MSNIFTQGPLPLVFNALKNYLDTFVKNAIYFFATWQSCFSFISWVHFCIQQLTSCISPILKVSLYLFCEGMLPLSWESLRFDLDLSLLILLLFSTILKIAMATLLMICFLIVFLKNITTLENGTNSWLRLPCCSLILQLLVIWAQPSSGKTLLNIAIHLILCHPHGYHVYLSQILTQLPRYLFHSFIVSVPSPLLIFRHPESIW